MCPGKGSTGRQQQRLGTGPWPTIMGAELMRATASSVGHAESGVMLSAPFHLACSGNADDRGPSQAIMLQHAPMPKTTQALCSRHHLPHMSYG